MFGIVVQILLLSQESIDVFLDTQVFQTTHVTLIMTEKTKMCDINRDVNSSYFY